jgi:hypothetical protein
LPSAAVSDHFVLGKSTTAMVTRTLDPDDDVPNDVYKGTIRYADGSTEDCSVVPDPYSPTDLLDIYATHQFKYPGTKHVRIRVDELNENLGEGFDITATVKVPFPTAAEILSDPTVRAQMDAVWLDTLNFTRRHHPRVQEEGFFILLNTDTGGYEFTPTAKGIARPLTSNKVGLETLGDPPGDSPFHLYPVADFHTHVPRKYVPKTARCGVGPSSDDVDIANEFQLPGFVYDYVATRVDYVTIREAMRKHLPLTDAVTISRGKHKVVIVPDPGVRGGMPIDAPATIYQFGPDHRPTPP